MLKVRTGQEEHDIMQIKQKRNWKRELTNWPEKYRMSKKNPSEYKRDFDERRWEHISLTIDSPTESTQVISCTMVFFVFKLSMTFY